MGVVSWWEYLRWQWVIMEKSVGMGSKESVKESNSQKH